MEDSRLVARCFGKNLNLLRKKAGISQENLAVGAGLHRTEIGLLERGERLPRIDTVLKLAAAVGVKVESPLLAGLEWSPGGVLRGGFVVDPRKERHEEAMRRAAALRAGQTEKVDAAELVREAREEMGERGKRGRRKDP